MISIEHPSARSCHDTSFGSCRLLLWNRFSFVLILISHLTSLFNLIRITISVTFLKVISSVLTYHWWHIVHTHYYGSAIKFNGNLMANSKPGYELIYIQPSLGSCEGMFSVIVLVCYFLAIWSLLLPWQPLDWCQLWEQRGPPGEAGWVVKPSYLRRNQRVR